MAVLNKIEKWFTLYKGDDSVILFVFEDENGNDIDLSSDYSEITFTMYDQSKTQELQYTIGSGLSIQNTNELKITLDDTTTGALDADQKYAYDIQFTLSSGDKETYIKGKFYVEDTFEGSSNDINSELVKIDDSGEQVVIELGSLGQKFSDYVGKSQDWAEGTDAEVTALGGEHSSKGWALESENFREQAAESAVSAQQEANNASYPANANLYDDEADFLASTSDGQFGIFEGSVWKNNSGVAQHQFDFITRVNSIQELLNVEGKGPNSRALVSGFYTQGDGGGGTFYWDAGEDKANHDGVMVIDPDHSATPASSGWWTAENTGTGCFKRPYNGYINTKWAGAGKEDGSNDSVPVQACVDYIVGTTEKVGEVRFGGGEYSFQSTVTVDADLSGIKFIALQEYSVTLKSDAVIDAFFKIGAGRLSSDSVITSGVFNFRMEQGSGSHDYGVWTEAVERCAVIFNQIKDAEINSIYFHDGGRNYANYNKLVGKATSKHIKLRNESKSYVQHNELSGGERGIEVVHGSNYNKISNNTILNTTVFGVVVSDDSGEVDPCFYNIISGNTADNCAKSYIFGQEAQENLFADNISVNATDIGFEAGGEVLRNTFLGNIAISSTNDNFAITGSNVRDTLFINNRSISPVNGADFAIRGGVGSSGTILKGNYFPVIIDNEGAKRQLNDEAEGDFLNQLEIFAEDADADIFFRFNDEDGNNIYRLIIDRSEDDQIQWFKQGYGNLIAFKEVGGTLSFGVDGSLATIQALTAPDDSTVNSGDATTDAVINNLRTRLDELESALQGHGILS